MSDQRRPIDLDAIQADLDEWRLISEHTPVTEVPPYPILQKAIGHIDALVRETKLYRFCLNQLTEENRQLKADHPKQTWNAGPA